MTKKTTIATIWLDGCSGCHMSFLDMDERLVSLADKVELVYSPLVDAKEFPDMVDVVLVEGSVSNTDDLKKIKKVRAHCGLLVSLGDCAVTGNVPAMRNMFGAPASYKRAYVENTESNVGTPGAPTEVVPALLDRVTPVHEVVKVDLFIPGCPPHADTIYYALCELLEGRIPNLSEHTRFGK